MSFGPRGSLVVGRGVLRRVDDAPRMQRLQLEGLAGELIDGAEHWHPYGLTSSPVAGAETLVLGAGGSREHAIVLVADRRYRLRSLPGGEVALHDDQGQVVHLTRDGIVVVSSRQIRIEAPRIEIDASEAVHIGAGGVGPTYTPSQITNYTAGIPTSSAPPKEVGER